MDGCGADVGLEDMSIADAVNAGAKTLVIGVANRGGVISEAWQDIIVEAIEAGMDVASGLHNLLSDEPVLVAAAEKNGRTLHDVRIPSEESPISVQSTSSESLSSKPRTSSPAKSSICLSGVQASKNKIIFSSKYGGLQKLFVLCLP